MIYGQPITLTATGAISTRQAKLVGFYVNSTTVGTIVINDNGVAISGVITPAVGWNFFPVGSSGALSATLGGTINVTFIFQPS
jgi:hypothetical protein